MCECKKGISNIWAKLTFLLVWTHHIKSYWRANSILVISNFIFMKDTWNLKTIRKLKNFEHKRASPAKQPKCRYDFVAFTWWNVPWMDAWPILFFSYFIRNYTTFFKGPINPIDLIKEKGQHKSLLYWVSLHVCVYKFMTKLTLSPLSRWNKSTKEKSVVRIIPGIRFIEA